jgi:DNA-binding transcriptional LysR family regulator
MIDNTKLKTFIFAAESLSFSEAAKQLNLTQPTVSYQIKALEKELGISLFLRASGHLKLTEAGRLLLPRARQIFHQSNEMEELLASLQDGVVGELRIACSTTAGKYLLPQLAARFCQRYPGIRVRIFRCISGDVALHLLEKEANLGVVSFEIQDENIEYQEFFVDSVSLIVPHNHPWAMRRVIEPEELINEPIIMRETSSGTRRVLLSQLAKFDIGVDDLNIFMELGNAEAIVRTVATGYAISFVSSLASACPLERGNVVDVRVKGFDMQRKVYMIRKRLDIHHRAQEVFWSFVHSPVNSDILALAQGENHHKYFVDSR